MGSSGGGGTNTVQTSQQIPLFEQQYAQNNLNLAQSLQSQPYPQYNAPLVAGMTDQQNQAMGMVPGAAESYQPDMQAAQGVTQGALNPWLNPNSALSVPGSIPTVNPNSALGIPQGISTENPMGAYNSLSANPVSPGVNAGNTFGAAGAQTMPQADMSAYMNPYVQQSLMPQLQQMQTQLGQEQNQINASATQAGAFGDARQGVESSLANLYGNQAMSGVEAQGLNSAYQSAQQAFQQDQANKLSAYQMGGQLGLGQEGANLNAFTGAQQASAQQNQSQLNAFQAAMQGGQNEQQIAQNAWNMANQSGQNEQQLQMQGGAQLGQLGASQQQLGLNAASALYSSGSQQQQLNQQALNSQYQQFLNQSQWPFQLLNVGESALALTPYNTVNNVTLPQANEVAQGLGAFSTAAGSLGSLFGGSSGGSRPSSYGLQGTGSTGGAGY